MMRKLGSIVVMTFIGWLLLPCMNPLWHHGLVQYGEPIDLLRVKTILLTCIVHVPVVGLRYKVLYDVRGFLVHEAKTHCLHTVYH